MRLLVVGGTQILGRQIILTAFETGHDVNLFTAVGRVAIGSKTASIGFWESATRPTRVWKIKVSTPSSTHVPPFLAESVRFLNASAGRAPRVCVLVSGVGMYKVPQHGADESAPAHTDGDPEATEVTGADHGSLKAPCEAKARNAWGVWSEG